MRGGQLHTVGPNGRNLPKIRFIRIAELTHHSNSCDKLTYELDMKGITGIAGNENYINLQALGCITREFPSVNLLEVGFSHKEPHGGGGAVAVISSSARGSHPLIKDF